MPCGIGKVRDRCKDSPGLAVGETRATNDPARTAIRFRRSCLRGSLRSCRACPDLQACGSGAETDSIRANSAAGTGLL